MSLTRTHGAAVVVAIASLSLGGCNRLLGIHEPVVGDGGRPATILDAGGGDADASVHGQDAAGDANGCSAGQMRCSAAGRPQKCNAPSTAYEDQDPCPSTMPLCDPRTGACMPGCTPDDRRCSPSGPVIQQCDLQGIWRDTSTVCPFVCSGSGSSTGCGGSCKVGTRSCGANNAPLLCDANGTDQAQPPCVKSLCVDGMCSGECKPGATQCVAGSTTMAQTCDGTGHWGPAAPCTFVCDATTGDCGGECSPGAPKQCSGNNVQSCDPTGHWQTTSSCTVTPCNRGECRACAAGAKQCNAGKPQTCSAAGVWIDDQAAACTYICDAASGNCGGVCVPGTDSCTVQVSKHCGANGMFDAGTTCINICDAKTGRCGGVCVPNAHRCNGQSVETCGADGQWAAGTVCPFGCNTTTSQCSTCTDDPMATTCAGGKCGPTLNNCNRMVPCTATCMGVGESCGGGGVTGVCGCTPKIASAVCGTRNCGTVSNGCSGMVNCGPLSGACPSGMACSNGTCASTCTPLTACPAGKNCSTIPNGCNTGMVTCGTMGGNCPTGLTCGVGNPGSPNVCGCAPLSMTAACTGGQDCDMAPNGCGGMLSCGTCMPPQTCAGAGTPGHCGCTPITTCPAGRCGAIPNGCNTGTISCGCGAGLTCCSGTCQSLKTNCGTCGHDCLGGECQSGACLPFPLATSGNGIAGLAVNSTTVFTFDNGTNIGTSRAWAVPKTGGTLTRLASVPVGVGPFVTTNAGYVGATDTLIIFQLYDIAGPTTSGLHSCTPSNCAATLQTWFSGFAGSAIACDLPARKCFVLGNNSNALMVATPTSLVTLSPGVSIANGGVEGLTVAGGFLYAAGAANAASIPLEVFERVLETGGPVTRLASRGALSGGSNYAFGPVRVTSGNAFFQGTIGAGSPLHYIFSESLPLGDGNAPPSFFPGASGPLTIQDRYYADDNGVFWLDSINLRLLTCPTSGCVGAPRVIAEPIPNGFSSHLTSDGQALYWIVVNATAEDPNLGTVVTSASIMKLAR